jgi:hypothetical protein
VGSGAAGGVGGDTPRGADRLMPLVVPSVVKRVIEEMFPRIVEDPSGNPGFQVDRLPALVAIVHLFDAIPQRLLVLNPSQYAALLASVAALRGSSDMLAAQRAGHIINIRLPGFARHPIAEIHAAISVCPDEAAPPSAAILAFLSESGLAGGLRIDISSALTALGNGEWKAATVIAGSVIEALLLWAITRHGRVAIDAARKGTKGPDKLQHIPGTDPGKWHLPEHIEVAGELGCIEPGTRVEARRMKEYRNLIHPGAVIRTRQQCDLGTAHIAVGTMHHVMRDLEAKGVAGACPV